MAVSLRVPESVRKRIAKLAQRAQFLAEANRRLAKVKKARSGIPAQAVFEYLEQRARGERAPRPRSRKLA